MPRNSNPVVRQQRTAKRRLSNDVMDDQDYFEDLDLDTHTGKNPSNNNKNNNNNNNDFYTEESIVHDHRRQNQQQQQGRRKLAGDDDQGEDYDNDISQVLGNALTVQPREAHHDRKEGLRGALGKKPLQQAGKSRKQRLFQDNDDDDDLGGGADDDDDITQANLATQMSRKDRQRLAEEDFDLVGVEGLSGSLMPPVNENEEEDNDDEEDEDDDEGGKMMKKKKKGDATILQVNSVASKFAALSTSERLQLIKQQSPEVEKLMKDLEKNLFDLKTVFAPLRSALFERKRAMQSASDSLLLEFLETKVQLMLSYCVHILFYLLLKVEGTKVTGHPVLKRLVELRVYMEKLHPVEQRLQHSITRLLSAPQGGGDSSSSSSAHGDVEIGGSARLNKLRPVSSEYDDLSGSAPSNKKYVVKKKSSTLTDGLRQRRRAEALADEMKAIEQEEERTMQRKRMSRAEAAKFTGALDPVPVDAQLQEEEDQYLANATSFLDDDDDDGDANVGGNNNNGGGVSLIEKLRARKKVQQQQQQVQDEQKKQLQDQKRSRDQARKDIFSSQKSQKTFGSGGGGGFDEEDFDGDDDEGFGEGGGQDVPDFDDLVREQQEREDEGARQAKRHRAEGTEAYENAANVSGRRNIDQDIQKHRGLTKARPKDRKSPRSNQRRKFKVGLRVAKSQNKKVTGGSDRELNVSLKPHVTHSTKF